MKRLSLLALLSAAGLLWWHWPKLALLLPLRGPATAIVVLADDPRRTEAALDLWQQLPEQAFWILGSDSLQRASQQQLLSRGLDPSSPRLGVLLQGDDTVGQLTSLSGRLPQSIGRVMLITDQSHRDRALAIALQALGTQGIHVQAPPARQLPPASPPEDPLRLHRDVLRVQLWRICGWDGRELGLWLRRHIF
ncbi:ElyC/SanA/YdcF family protein [Synechococcus sp. RS9907]|uniref:ElyC/SanA/YdcF family protein n=1 Tax=Synechococcus sp. RS9907 TaxID=221350 RepID=UPI00165DA4EB|nr:ElyC/SanA/YdcF family protein [Synechococcus sp. RS9907]